MSTDDTQTPLGGDEPSAGLEADAAADAAADANAAVAPPADVTGAPGAPATSDGGATPEPDAGAQDPPSGDPPDAGAQDPPSDDPPDAGAQDPPSGDPPDAGAQDPPNGDPPDVAARTQESAPWRPGPTTDLDAAAHRIIDGPSADPPRRARPAAAPARPAAAPESPPWRGPPPAPPSEELRPSAPHVNADTPLRGHAPPSVQSGPTGPRTVTETPSGHRFRARADRVAGLAQTASHAQGETPAGGDSRAMEQRMHPKGASGALTARLERVMAQRKALLADPDFPRRRRRERPPGPLDGDGFRRALRQRIAEAKK